jgi:hypothetical protein
MARSPLKAPPFGVREPLSAYARRFRIPARTAKRWAAEGRIPGAKKVGQRWFVHRSKAADAFGTARLLKREPWSHNHLTDWDREVALQGMNILPTSRIRAAISSDLDTLEFVGAALDLAFQDDTLDTYSVGKLMEDRRFPEIARKFLQAFPRNKKREIAEAILAACFDFESFDPTKSVDEAERRALERKRRKIPKDSDRNRDLHLTNTKPKRRFFSVSAFAQKLGLSRSAIYRAFKKMKLQKPATSFRLMLTRRGSLAVSTDL